MSDDDLIPNGELSTNKPDKRLDVVDYEIHGSAKKHVENLLMDFAVALVLQAKTLAYYRKDGTVTQNHIKEALDIIQKEPIPKRWRNWIGALGGAFMGAFVSGFISELSTAKRAVWLATYVALGFLGFLLMLVGLGR